MNKWLKFYKNCPQPLPLMHPATHGAFQATWKCSKGDSSGKNLMWTEIAQKLLSVLFSNEVGKATNKVLVGKPAFKLTSKKMIIQVPYFAMTLHAFSHSICPQGWLRENMKRTGPFKSAFNLEANDTTKQEVKKVVVNSCSREPWKQNQIEQKMTGTLFTTLSNNSTYSMDNISSSCSLVLPPAHLQQINLVDQVSDADKSIEVMNVVYQKGYYLGKALMKHTELRLVRLQYPYLDSTILAQYVAMNASKYNFTRMQKTLLTKVSLVDPQSNKQVTHRDLCIAADPFQSIFQTRVENLPSSMTGLKVELAGQLTTQRTIPRKTVSNFQKGSFTSSSSMKTCSAQNSALNFAQYTSKNKLGAFTVKVWLSDANS